VNADLLKSFHVEGPETETQTTLGDWVRPDEFRELFQRSGEEQGGGLAASAMSLLPVVIREPLSSYSLAPLAITQ
jgi:hypothetical protein